MVKKVKNVQDPSKVERRIGASKLGAGYLDPLGRELPNPTPLQPPVGFKREPTIAERVREMVRSERLRQEALSAGAETFEEADDFDVGDDYDPTSPYEEVFEPVPDPWDRFRDAHQEAVERALRPAEGGGVGEPPTGEAAPVKGPQGRSEPLTATDKKTQSK